MPPRLVVALLRVFAAGLMVYGYREISTLAINEWISSQKGGHFQFLTIQGLAVAWISMMLGLVTDLFPSVSAFGTCKRVLFMISMPVAVVVSSIYWSLLYLFPHLILIPESGKPSSAPPILARLPFRMDLAMHITPLVSLVADFLFLEREYTKNEVRYGAALVITLSTMWYSSWVEYCAQYNGVFPYPFLTNNPLHIRVVIYATAGGLAWVSFWAINACHPGRLRAGDRRNHTSRLGDKIE